MSVRQKANRVAIIGFTVFGCALAVIGVALIATGRLCITSPRRLADQYGLVLAESGRDGESPAAGDPATAFGSDADADGIDDNDDVLAAALAYVETRPHYKSVYYASGYPDDEFGVCTDVVATACRAAGYDLQALVAADVAIRPNAYAIDVPDSAIDFRRTPNLEVFSTRMRSALRRTWATSPSGAAATSCCTAAMWASSPIGGMPRVCRI